MVSKLSGAFAAGTLGGLVNSLAVWIFGEAGISAAMGVDIHPHLSPPWLYQRLVWGGIWGFLFLLPILKKSVMARGLLFSIGPSIVMLLLVFPNMGKGAYGLSLGTLTPLLVLIFNAVWGLVAALWYSASAE